MTSPPNRLASSTASAVFPEAVGPTTQSIGILFACGIGYTLQPIGQKYAEPTTASIIMSLESVFALLFGVMILGDRPSMIEVIGSAIMLTAIILIQIPIKRRK